MKKEKRNVAFNVYLNGKKIDTVFYDRTPSDTIAESEDDVKRSLINHDGYNPNIVVRAER